LRTSALRALGRELFQALSWGVLWRLKILFSEGIETVGERDFLYGAGISLMQGYLFARPAFKSAASVDPQIWPAGSH
jgi:predicted signal transduction protein with EAL and GGDEF domain